MAATSRQPEATKCLDYVNRFALAHPHEQSCSQELLSFTEWLHNTSVANSVALPTQQRYRAEVQQNGLQAGHMGMDNLLLGGVAVLISTPVPQ